MSSGLQVIDTEAAEAGIPSAADHDSEVKPFHHRRALDSAIANDTLQRIVRLVYCRSCLATCGRTCA